MQPTNGQKVHVFIRPLRFIYTKSGFSPKTVMLICCLILHHAGSDDQTPGLGAAAHKAHKH